MRLRTTSTQRTYRYLRLGLLLVVAAIGVAVAIQLASGVALTSISAAYGTPARNVFVGGLFAVSLALLALSGHSLEQALLDVAAALAPVIALVPVPAAIGASACADARCVTAAALADIDAGMLTLAIVAPLVVVTTLVVAGVQRTLTRGVAVTAAIIVVVLAAFVVWWRAAPLSFAHTAHYAATVVFFVLVAAVAVLAAVAPAAATSRRRRGLRIVYTTVAAGIVASLGFLVAAVTGSIPGSSGVLTGEAAALALFAIFWLAQSIEFWNEVDPAFRAGPRE